MAVKAQLALRIYRRNPAAAYIAEIQNAFGSGYSVGKAMTHDVRDDSGA
jgi:hypothetical protein